MKQEAFLTLENINSKTARWISDIYSGISSRTNIRLVPERCALMIIDMLRYFADPGGSVFLPSTEAITPRIASLLDMWRRLGGVVVFTRHCHMGIDDLGMLGRFFSDHIRCGSPDAEIIPALAPAEGETVIRKSTYDSFHGTSLEEHLKEGCVSQVLVTGVLTQMCCETTARSAFVRGFEVFVAADATTTSTEEHHLASLRNMASCVAVVTDTASILERIP